MNLYVSMTEFANALGVARQTLYAWIKTGKLKVEKNNNNSSRYRFTRDNVVVFLEEHRDKLNDQVKEIERQLDTSINIKELANALGVSRQTFYNWIKNRKLKVERGNTKHILNDDIVIVFLKEHRDKLNDQVKKIDTLLDTLKYFKSSKANEKLRRAENELNKKLMSDGYWYQPSIKIEDVENKVNKKSTPDMVEPIKLEFDISTIEEEL